MNEQKLAKKIVSYLNESPMSKSVENSLFIARKNALERAKKENFVEIINTTDKSKINNFKNGYENKEVIK